MDVHEDLAWQATSNNDLEDVTNALISESNDKSESKNDGSRPGRATNFKRERMHFDAQLFKNYFVEYSTYPPNVFKRQYRLSCASLNEL